jgi:predicted Zn-ribbon and HTH transcriptional regulator
MSQKYTWPVMKQLVEIKTDNEYSLLELDEKATAIKKRHMKIRHNKCGYEYRPDIYEFVQGKRKCPKCKGAILRKHFAQTLEAVIARVEQMTDKEYSFVDTHYVNANTLHKYRHNTCGTIFEKKWNKFRVGQRCPNCLRRGMDSMSYHYLKDIFEYFAIEYELEKEYEACFNSKTGKRLKFDFYIPAINLLIEVDGEQHERASYGKENFKETQYRDNLKNSYVEKEKIELLRIPAKLWSRLPEVIAPYISQILNKPVSAAEIKRVKQSNIPDRINKDLKKHHNGEYILVDNFYTGIDREHTFKHTTCNHIFRSTLYFVKSHTTPCLQCRKKEKLKKSFKRRAKLLYERSNKKYSLDPTHIEKVDDKSLVKCNVCKERWYVNVGNLLSNNGGCPNCQKIQRLQTWKEQYKEALSCVEQKKKFPEPIRKWIGHNKKRYEEGKLEPYKVRLLTSKEHNFFK